MDGSGLVTNGGNKYGGFFFTNKLENAEYYSEYFVAKVSINNIQPDPTKGSHPPTILKKAIADGKNYFIHDVLDGSHYSDIVVVPNTNLIDIKIIDWLFVSEKEFYYEQLDNFFGGEEEEEEPYINQDIIESMISMTGEGLEYLLSIPIFNEYYNSKA